MKSEPTLDVTLFQGGGTSNPDAISLWNLPRNHLYTKKIAYAFSKKSKLSDPYFVEQVTFCLSLLPYIIQKKPDVIYFSDFNLGTMLWHLRRIMNLSYKLLFSNGAPNGPPFTRMDHVQHLTPLHYQIAIDAGESKYRHSLVPYGINLQHEYHQLSQSERDSLLAKLNLPVDRPIILSVAAINKTHKRMDYVIQEVSQLPEPRPFLILLGQMDHESAEVIQLADRLLGKLNFLVKTVTYDELCNYYNIADLFVLASLREGLPRVLLEAMGHGLPCLVHDYEVTRFVLGDEGNFSDFNKPGNLTALMQKVLSQHNNFNRLQLHNIAFKRFSWECLRKGYISLIKETVETCDSKLEL
ncbi:MAG: glycosyltransferase family 4 protein [Thermosynechococcaceae cyanobacterium MS004]|nr:glycosyltransferase family 4 protein [Thermosynechococcaceae cyanobacterium MS004]